MINAIGVEPLKLRTTRLTHGLLLTGAAITALFTILESVQAPATRPPAPGRPGLRPRRFPRRRR